MLDENHKHAIVCECPRHCYTYAHRKMEENIEKIFFDVHEIIRLVRHSYRSGFIEG